MGLALPIFDSVFDDHFDVRSSLIDAALRGQPLEGNLRAEARCAQLPRLLHQPEAWGMGVRTLWRFWQYVAMDLLGYVAAHDVDADGRHVCLVSPCHWHHHTVTTTVGPGGAQGELRRMRADMGLVVDRYVKPWTEDSPGAGLALLLNAGQLAQHDKTVGQLCTASLFISHTWSEDFQVFAQTLRNSLCPDRVVWICSLAIFQHGDISSALSCLETSPFAVAMRHTERVMLVMDDSAEALQRCWVVLEAKFAQLWGKPYDICLPDDEDENLWRVVGKKLRDIDIVTCNACHEEDKTRILRYAREQSGGVTAVNKAVRSAAQLAQDRAELMSAAKAGDLDRLSAVDDPTLKGFRSIRNRTVVHILARYCRVDAMVKVLLRTGDSFLHHRDRDGLTPLAVAVESGALASAEALVVVRARLDIPAASGLRPLHYAASNGHRTITRLLLEAKACQTARGTYRGEAAHTPLTIAAREGFKDLVEILVLWGADLNARASGLSALHHAARHGHSDVAACLVVAMAEVDAPSSTEFGRTPAMLAVKGGCVALVGFLLAAQADPSARDSRGHTFHDYCNNDLMQSFLERLAESRPDSPNPSAVPLQRRLAMWVSWGRFCKLLLAIHGCAEDGGPVAVGPAS